MVNHIHKLSLLLIGILLLISLAPIVQAANLNSWDVDVTLNDDGSANWRVILNYKDSVQHDDYWVLGDLQDVKVTVDGTTVNCKLTKPDVGTSIICDNIDGSLVVYSFHVTNAAGKWGNFKQFRYTFPITSITDRFALKVSLPLGNALVDASKLTGTGFAPFEPAFGKQGSDGRLIFVTWELQNPKLGETINAGIIYEPLSQSQVPILPMTAIVAVVIGVLIYMFYFRKKPENLLPALIPTERSVMELIIKQRSIDQRDVVRSTGFSKAKVSRIIQTLIDRRLVEAVPKGRTRELKLAKQSTVQEGVWSRLFRFKVKKNVEKMALNRAQALEIVQTTLTPMIDWLDSVAERLHRHKYGYAWNGSSYNIDERFENPLSEVLIKEVSKMLPSTDNRLESYKDGIEKITGVLKRMERSVMGNITFVNACKKLSVRYPNLGKDVAYNLVRHVIDKDQVIRDEYPWHALWNSNASALSRLAEARIKNSRTELQRSTQPLMRTCSLFRRELDQVREHLRKEHHLLFRELRA